VLTMHTALKHESRGPYSPALIERRKKLLTAETQRTAFAIQHSLARCTFQPLKQ